MSGILRASSPFEELRVSGHEGAFSPEPGEGSGEGPLVLSLAKGQDERHLALGLGSNNRQ